MLESIKEWDFKNNYKLFEGGSKKLLLIIIQEGKLELEN